MSLFPSRARKGAVSLSFVILLVSMPTSVLSASVYVAANGTDSGSCGLKPDPCRSITQGIANAAVGSSVVVGPGSYGDVNRNGILGEAGEEPSPGPCGAESCMIHVDKAVTITSSSGAFATAIAPGSSAMDAAVLIAAAGAQFGAFGKGFTVASPGDFDNSAIISVARAPGASIEGNVIQSIKAADSRE